MTTTKTIGVTAPVTLAELVRELRETCPCLRTGRRARSCSAPPCNCFASIVRGGILMVYEPSVCAWPGHAFEERLIAAWHEEACNCPRGYTNAIDPRCAEARRAAREAR